MKYLFMFGGAFLGIFLGFVPRNSGAVKPGWWKWLTIASVTITIVMAIMPPIAGNIRDVVTQNRIDSMKVVPALVIFNANDSTLTDARSPNVIESISNPESEIISSLPDGSPAVVGLRRSGSDASVEVVDVMSIDPTVTLPYIIGLEERARIMFFHVPMSWVAVVAYMISMIFAIRYMRMRDIEQDDVSSAAASIGTLYTVLATVTGSVWAKFNWGSFWNWDPRESSIFILLLIYAAYFLLRSAIDDPERRARLSSVYSVIAFLTAPFLIFVLPRLLPGLHPGSADDTNAGPLLSPRSTDINPVKQMVFGVALFGFTMIYFWLMNMQVRFTRIERARAFQQDEA